MKFANKMLKFISKIRKRTLFFGLLAIVLAVIYMFSGSEEPKRPETNPEGNLELTFIDVGQGSSVLMETSNNKIILFDGGESSAYDTHLSPYLESHGIDSVDTAIVSHYHSDHMGGISELLKEGKIKRLILPDYPVSPDEKDFWVKYARKTNAKIEYASAGDTLDCECPGLLVDVMNPPKDGVQSDSYHNDNSLVLRIIYGKTGILLTGDIEHSAESKVLSLNENIECEILQVAHHGSYTSTSSRFLDKTNPTYAVIQSGAGNRYGHPHYETLSNLEDSDARIYRNDTDGHVTFTVGPTSIIDVSCIKSE